MGLLNFAQELSNDIAKEAGTKAIQRHVLVLPTARSRTLELIYLFSQMIEKTIGRNGMLFTFALNALNMQLHWLTGRGYSADAALLTSSFAFAYSFQDWSSTAAFAFPFAFAFGFG